MIRPGLANFRPAPLEWFPGRHRPSPAYLGSVHAANYIGIEWPCGRYVVRRVSGRCGGRLGSGTGSLRSGAGNSPVSLAACLPNASVLGVAQLRVGSGIQQRNWSLSRCAAASSPASCRRMGGFPGPKRSFLVAIILAIKLDQVERDQGGTWKAPRACVSPGQPARGFFDWPGFVS